MRIITTICVVFLAPIVAGCSSDDETNSGSAEAEQTKVVAAFYPLAWVAEQVGGDDVDVQNLTPPGLEPHDLELSPEDVAAIEQADVVLYLGDGFQPAIEDAVANSDARKVDVLTLDGVDLNDPHVWLDPNRLATIVAHVAAELDADDSATLEVLASLDDDFEQGLRTCERREIFTSHAAFGYLADRYDLEQIAISGLSPEAEPLPRDLKRAADKAKEHEATTIYFETLVSPKLSEQVADEVGAKTAVLDPIEGIDQDRLDDGIDYVDVMRENLGALRDGLGCS